MKKANPTRPKPPKSPEPILTRGEKLVLALCFLAISACVLYNVLGIPNEAQPVIIYKDGTSGYQIVSGSQNGSVYAPLATSAVSSVTGKINVNTDGIDRLTQLPGIGEVRAQAIIEYRVLRGKFTCAEDLLNVDGIGEKTLEQLREHICF